MGVTQRMSFRKQETTCQLEATGCSCSACCYLVSFMFHQRYIVILSGGKRQFSSLLRSLYFSSDSHMSFPMQSNFSHFCIISVSFLDIDELVLVVNIDEILLSGSLAISINYLIHNVIFLSYNFLQLAFCLYLFLFILFFILFSE